MRIGTVETKNRVFAAPMAGVTDKAFRILLHRMGCGLIVTEMASAKALTYSNRETFENLSDDIFTLKGFWNNKVTRILLIVSLANVGGSLGTFIGGANVVRLFLQNL
jgi:tRNA-dihydrouridine synthase